MKCRLQKKRKRIAIQIENSVYLSQFNKCKSYIARKSFYNLIILTTKNNIILFFYDDELVRMFIHLCVHVSILYNTYFLIQFIF